MQSPFWTYYAPGEVDRAVEHIDVLVGRGAEPEKAAQDAAYIYRQRTGDHRTPFVRAHLVTQWRVRHRGSPGGEPGALPGPLTNRPKFRRQPAPSKYPSEVSFRASFHRLFYE
jgi:hypothetical protein